MKKIIITAAAILFAVIVQIYLSVTPTCISDKYKILELETKVYDDMRVELQQGMLDIDTAFENAVVALEKTFPDTTDKLEHMYWSLEILSWKSDMPMSVYYFDCGLSKNKDAQFSSRATMDAFSGEILMLEYTDYSFKEKANDCYRYLLTEDEIITKISDTCHRLGYTDLDKYYFEKLEDTDNIGTKYTLLVLADDKVMCFSGDSLDSYNVWESYPALYAEHIDLLNTKGTEFTKEG